MPSKKEIAEKTGKKDKQEDRKVSFTIETGILQSFLRLNNLLPEEHQKHG